jgi:aspartate aminotransferase
MTSNASTPTQVAALEAFSNREDSARSLEEMGEAFRRRRDLVVAQIHDLLPDVPFVKPGGAFYLYFRVDGFFGGDVQDATAWCSALLEHAGVALVPGAAFGDDRWVRMSFATSDHVLEEAFRRIAATVGAASPR